MDRADQNIKYYYTDRRVDQLAIIFGSVNARTCCDNIYYCVLLSTGRVYANWGKKNSFHLINDVTLLYTYVNKTFLAGQN